MQTTKKNLNIIAQITASGYGAIAGIRLSGNDVRKYCQDFFNIKILKARYAYYIKSSIDDLILIYYKAPNSYTGEDVIELFCHGNQNIVELLINSFLRSYDIRTANPGEFTKRAFLNSKMDLVQAESVIDLINSSSELLIKNQKSILEGSLSSKYLAIKSDLLNLVIEAEMELEFEEDSVFNFKKAKEIINKIYYDVEGLVNIYSKYKDKINEILICIVGIPNVGKSSLFNALIKENRAIVHEKAGTTRDYIEAKFKLGTYNINLVDTAGLRDKDIGSVEQIGIENTNKLISKAIFLIEVFDNDSFTPIRKDSIYIRNKLDLKKDKDFIKELIYVSAKEEENINFIYNKIKEKLDLEFKSFDETKQFISLRQYELLKVMLSILKNISIELEKELEIDIVSVELASSIDIINDILGIEARDEILDSLFSKFCVGK